MLGLERHTETVVDRTEPVKPAPAKPATDAAATPPAPAGWYRSRGHEIHPAPDAAKAAKIDPGPAGGKAASARANPSPR